MVFFKQLPLEFSAVLSKLLPAMFGGTNLMLMGVYSYLSETTPEEDRTFRFNLFAQCIIVIPIIFIPMAGPLFSSLGYMSKLDDRFGLHFKIISLLPELLLLCIPINVAGLLYGIFVLKEVDHKNATTEKNGIDNPGFDNANSDATAQVRSSQNGHHGPSANPPEEKKNFFVDFFNPTVAVQCLNVIMRKRKNQGRAVILLLFFIYFMTVGPAFGEEPNEYNFVRIKLNWDGTAYGNFISFGSLVSVIGSFIMATILSKMLKITDPALAIIGSSFSAVSRLIYVRDEIDFEFIFIMVIKLFFFFLSFFIDFRDIIVHAVRRSCVRFICHNSWFGCSQCFVEIR